MNTTALIFRNTTFDVVDHNGDTWLRGLQVASALGYKNPSADISNLYDRHADEFTADMTAMVKLPTEGGEQEIRIFSPRGCYALAMFARTKAAKEFRRWVLDVLEAIRKTGKYEAAPYSVNPNDTLTKTQADTLRDLLTSTVKKLPQEKQASAMIRGWSKLKSHFGTGYRQIPQSEYAEALSIVARHCVTVHALEGELLEAEPKHTSLNETVASLVRQLESPNGVPSAVFMPLVNAVLKKQGFDLSNSPQMKPPAFSRSLPSGTPDAKRNLAAVQKVLRNLRSWGIEELPRHVRPDFCDAIAEIDSLLVTGWTEVDEALTRIELGTSFLKRWNKGGGCGIGRIQFIA